MSEHPGHPAHKSFIASFTMISFFLAVFDLVLFWGAIDISVVGNQMAEDSFMIFATHVFYFYQSYLAPPRLETSPLELNPEFLIDADKLTPNFTIHHEGIIVWDVFLPPLLIDSQRVVQNATIGRVVEANHPPAHVEPIHSHQEFSRRHSPSDISQVQLMLRKLRWKNRGMMQESQNIQAKMAQLRQCKIQDEETARLLQFWSENEAYWVEQVHLSEAELETAIANERDWNGKLSDSRAKRDHQLQFLENFQSYQVKLHTGMMEKASDLIDFKAKIHATKDQVVRVQHDLDRARWTLEMKKLEKREVKSTIDVQAGVFQHEVEKGEFELAERLNVLDACREDEAAVASINAKLKQVHMQKLERIKEMNENHTRVMKQVQTRVKSRRAYLFGGSVALCIIVGALAKKRIVMKEKRMKRNAGTIPRFSWEKPKPKNKSCFPWYN